MRKRTRAGRLDCWQHFCLVSELSEAVSDWSLNSFELKMIQIGVRRVGRARAIIFQLAKVAVTGPMVRAIRASIRLLRAPPSWASPRPRSKPNESGRAGADALKKMAPSGRYDLPPRLDPHTFGRFRERRHCPWQPILHLREL